MDTTKKNSITEDERNEVFSTLNDKEFQTFGIFLSNLIYEYRHTGKIELSSLTPILGNPPRIYQSTEMDAMLEAYDEKATYGDKVKSIENFIRYEVERGH